VRRPVLHVCRADGMCRTIIYPSRLLKHFQTCLDPPLSAWQEWQSCLSPPQPSRPQSLRSTSQLQHSFLLATRGSQLGRRRSEQTDNPTQRLLSATVRCCPLRSGSVRCPRLRYSPHTVRCSPPPHFVSTFCKHFRRNPSVRKSPQPSGLVQLEQERTEAQRHWPSCSVGSGPRTESPSLRDGSTLPNVKRGHASHDRATSVGRVYEKEHGDEAYVHLGNWAADTLS
jgi:hypothetical protein